LILSKKNLDVIVSAPFAGVLQPEHNGRVPTVGTAIRVGQLLATLTPAAQTADGSDNFAKQYVEAKTAKDLAASEFRRAQYLYEKEAISQKEFQEAEAEFKEAEANFSAIAKYVQPDDEKPQRPNEFNFLLKAPIAGIVAETHFVLGKQFEAGEPLFRIVNSAIVWLQASVPVAEADKLRAPRRAEFRIAGFDETFEVNDKNGKLVSFSSVVDEKSRTVPIVFEVANPMRRLRVGMFADVLIKTGEEEHVLVVSESALIEEEGRYSVYVHAEGEAFAKREVELGGTDRGFVAVLKGVKEGERVVTAGAYQVRLASLSTQLPAHGHEH
jgi:RND family efflux transporter MFP subunit